MALGRSLLSHLPSVRASEAGGSPPKGWPSVRSEHSPWDSQAVTVPTALRLAEVIWGLLGKLGRGLIWHKDFRDFAQMSCLLMGTQY